MKTAKPFLFILIAILLLSSAAQNTYSQFTKDKFYLGTFNFSEWPFLRDAPSIANYHSLSLNLMQGYGFHYDADPTNYDGGFNDSLSTYSGNINSMLSWWTSNYGTNGMIFEREKVLRPAYGKRSDYQAEYTSSQLTGGSIRPGYGFTTSNGSTYTETWQGESVSGRTTGMPDSPSPYYLVKNLYENREQFYTPQRGQTGNQHDLVYLLSCRKKAPFHYYIKPRMRIDSAFAKTHQTTPVVAVIVKNYSGHTIDSVVITCFNFLDSNGFYNGKYLEMYRFSNNDSALVINADSLITELPEDLPVTQSQLAVNAVDYQVYWFAQVDVHLDYVRVDDEWAHFLFNPDPNHKYDFVYKIEQEANYLNGAGGFGYFYMDEFNYSTMPCIAEVNRILQTVNANFSIIPLVNDDYFWPGGSIKNPPLFSDGYFYLHNSGAVQDILMTDIYPITDKYFLPPNVTLPNKTTYPGTRRYEKATNNELYDDSLNGLLENGDWIYNGNQHEPSFMDRYRKCGSIVKATQTDSRPLIFSLAVQIHSFESLLQCDTQQFAEREPTNEEISMQCYLGLIYGAKQIVHYIYPSGRVSSTCHDTAAPYLNDLGLLGRYDNQDGIVRDTNYYGQHKWNFITHLDSILTKIGKYMYTDHNFKYDTTATVNTTLNTRTHLPLRFINDIMSVVPGISGQNPCTVDYQTSAFPYGPYCDCPDVRYWELGFFTTSEPNIKYFMALNKRCAPGGNGYASDKRILRINFIRSEFSASVNWKITEVGSKAPGMVFSRNNTGYVDLNTAADSLGLFKPGEGKLFKIEPVPQSGGILVENDTLSGVNITCSDTIITDGHNLVISGNSTLSFTDSATIIIAGGTLQIGNAGDGITSSKNTFQSTGSGHKWKGIQCTSATVKIYNAKFQDVHTSDTGNYSLNCINCPITDLRYNTFISADTSNGGVNISYITSPFGSLGSASAYVNYNTFTMNDSRYNAVQVQGFAGLTTGIYAEHNSMTSNGYATGIFLSTITGGVISNNSITGFSTGVNTLLSSADMYGNNVQGSSHVSHGIFAAGLSSINLAPSGGTWLGGRNILHNEHINSTNIEINNSAFTMTDGNNTLTVDNDTGSYHMFGFFMDESYEDDNNGNCYVIKSAAVTDPNLPKTNLTDYLSNPASIRFNYTCDAEAPPSTEIVDIGNGLYDTIPQNDGYGGGESSINNYELPITNSKAKNVGQRYIFDIQNIKHISDSIHIQLRRRNYSAVKNLCYELIDTYPDSMQSIASLQTLYMAVSATDTTTSGRTALKTYYENLILNHGDNAAIVTISNYFVQKCKVLLKQYSSALSGFQSIINNNQYSYEGLLARWDYMATSLLMSGSGGGEFVESPVPSELPPLERGIKGDLEEEIKTLDELYTLYDSDWKNDGENTPKNNGDDNPKKGKSFTEGQKKAIVKNVINVTKTKRENDETKINRLKERSDKGDETARHELNQKMALKNTIKTEKPKNMYEHLRIVSSDIHKVFGNNEQIVHTVNNSVPGVFKLHQNYPNPFNPTATIKYDLPKDAKVTMKIYDILGREVKILVNDFKKAGFYQVTFDGTNLASGVYFYKIEAGDFIDSKKMVLVK